MTGLQLFGTIVIILLIMIGLIAIEEILDN